MEQEAFQSSGKMTELKRDYLTVFSNGMYLKVVVGFELKVGTLGSYLPGLENSNKTGQSAQTHHISTD